MFLSINQEGIMRHLSRRQSTVASTLLKSEEPSNPAGQLKIPAVSDYLPGDRIVREQYIDII
jgi:hypothetical protein